MVAIVTTPLFTVFFGGRGVFRFLPNFLKILRVTGAALVAMTAIGLSACSVDSAPKEAGAEFALPALAAADLHWIATRIFQNETRGQARYLTYWGAGEDFPSLGIGHFIWFPAGVDAPFDETFPALVNYLKTHDSGCTPIPAWLNELAPFDAPWTDKVAFDQALNSDELLSLRHWLAGTAPQQAAFIASNFEQRWSQLELPAADKTHLTQLLQQIVSTREGLFAAVDYFNFKGLGSNPRERYAEQGWGLLQVLGDVAAAEQPGDDARALLQRFSEAAAKRLRNRVALSPPERNEARWLEGWLSRVAEYVDVASAEDDATSGGFRVTPYVQNPTATSATLMWFSDSDSPGQLSVHRNVDGKSELVLEQSSQPLIACELNYDPLEIDALPTGRLPTTPLRHQIRLQDLQPATLHHYEVVQNGQHAGGDFHTAPAMDDTDASLRFVVYGDSETEPESTGKHAPWGGEDEAAASQTYILDQTTGYRENLLAMGRYHPDFIAIAGDLVQSGGEQRDWDEFWKQNAEIAAGTPIFPALGNHDYFGGPRKLGGYGNVATRRAVGKFKTYFDLPDNNVASQSHRESYYSISWGPATLIVVDGNDGVPHRSNSDSNWYLLDESQGGVAPAWNPGSEQYAWLEKTLQAAQQRDQFTFVMFHAPPYSSGVHGRPPGLGEGLDYLPGSPLQALTPLFMKYGVDAVFNGHDELYEHSAVPGVERLPDGQEQSHEIQFFTVGIGGDGLRSATPGAHNPYRVFSVDADAPPVYDKAGGLIDGGAHYGHLEVTVDRDAASEWRARFEPVYVFPVTAEDGTVLSFERRLYDDVTVISRAGDSRPIGGNRISDTENAR